MRTKRSNTVGAAQSLLFESSPIQSERHLAGMAEALGAARLGPLSAAEERLLASAVAPASRDSKETRAAIDGGRDVLGEAFCALRTPERRRTDGATYTPASIVRAMLAWCSDHGKPGRVIDPGTGSGRFLLAAGAMFPKARLIGVEFDPLAALVARANLVQAGFQDRASVIVSDYRNADLAETGNAGPTLFVGNPPYVRHHNIAAEWKAWLMREGLGLGLETSTLAGLHVHFFIATANRMRPGDFGCFITSAEWLDVNYGRMLRQLFLSRLGGTRLVLIEPKVEPFPDAATTGAISCFQAEAKPRSIFAQRIESVSELKRLNGSRRVRRERFELEPRWSHLMRRLEPAPEGYVELGELCRVHRGQVTGANDVWVADTARFRLPASVLFRTVTRARELFSAGLELASVDGLRQVVDFPVELDAFRAELSAAERRGVDDFLKFAKSQGAHEGYIARTRKAWWSVGLREPAPILATYMARRPPAFVTNTGKARHLNIAHGLYPRENFSHRILRNLVEFLSSAVKLTSGRTYAGGLTKFEPREMERILVPEPRLLESGALA